MFPQQVLAFHYPDSTIVQTEPKYRLRHIEVRYWRDLTKSPLSIDEYLRRPLIHRGRMLAAARDLQTNQHRRFYLASSRENFVPSLMRVGVFDPITRKLLDIISRGFHPTRKDRLHLARLLIRWREYDFGDMRVGVFADDLRVIS